MKAELEKRYNNNAIMYTNVKNFYGHYVDEQCKDLIKMDAEGHRYTDADWKNLIHRHENANCMLYAIASTPCCPEHLMPLVAESAMGNDDRDKEVVIKALERKDLTEETVDAIFRIVKNMGPVYAQYTNIYAITMGARMSAQTEKDQPSPFGDIVERKMLEKLPEFIRERNSQFQLKLSMLGILCQARDTDAVIKAVEEIENMNMSVRLEEKYIRENAGEIARSLAVNNGNLPAHIREKLFAEGVNPELLINITPAMSTSLYMSIMENFEYHIKNLDENDRIKSNASSLLMYMIRAGILTPDMEWDLMNQVVEQRDRSASALAYEILMYTRNPGVVELATNLKSNTVNDAYTNKLCPDDTTIQKIEGYCKSIEKGIKANNIELAQKCLTKPARNIIKRAIERCTLRENQYKALMHELVNDPEFVMGIALSKHTPISVLQALEELPDKKDARFLASAQTTAAFAKRLRQYNVPDEMFEKITQYWRNRVGTLFRPDSAVLLTNIYVWEASCPGITQILSEIMNEMSAEKNAYKNDPRAVNMTIGLNAYKETLKLCDEKRYAELSSEQYLFLDNVAFKKYCEPDKASPFYMLDKYRGMERYLAETRVAYDAVIEKEIERAKEENRDENKR